MLDYKPTINVLTSKRLTTQLLYITLHVLHAVLYMFHSLKQKSTFKDGLLSR